MAKFRQKWLNSWWLSGLLAALGGLIAIFAGQELMDLTLITLALAVVVTILLGMALSARDTSR